MVLPLSSIDLPTLKLVTLLQDDLGIDQFVPHRLLNENLSCGVQNVFNISASPSAILGSLVSDSPFIGFAGLMDVPCLLSINSSKTFVFLISTSLWISEGLRCLTDLLGTTFPLPFNTHWHISLPSPLAGPSTLPRTSCWLGKAAVCSR
jgi:hypothetical protein